MVTLYLQQILFSDFLLNHLQVNLNSDWLIQIILISDWLIQTILISDWLNYLQTSSRHVPTATGMRKLRCSSATPAVGLILVLMKQILQSNLLNPHKITILGLRQNKWTSIIMPCSNYQCWRIENDEIIKKSGWTWKLFSVCWSSPRQCDHILSCVNGAGLALGQVGDTAMFYCNTCGESSRESVATHEPSSA